MESSVEDLTTGLFIGPLQHGKKTSAKKIAKHLFRLMISVGVRSRDIARVIVDPEDGFALVQMRTREAEDFMLKACNDVREVLNFFDLRLLTPNPKHFQVIRRGSPRFGVSFHKEDADNESSASPVALPSDASPSHTAEGGPGRTDSPPTIASGPVTDVQRPIPRQNACNDNTLTKTSTDSSSSVSQHEFEQLEEEAPAPILLHASTSVSASHNEDVGSSPPVLMVDVKTSTPHVSPCFCPETVFYHKRQHVGSENRHVEFKRGGNVSDLRTFRSMVGKYMCAFLNTEGGTIYFGVTDDGKVVGIDASQKAEDTIRLTIDNAVAMIKPPASTSTYSVNFAKVMEDDGSIVEDLKVLEVCVKPREPPREKFAFNDVAYVRRDGSLRTL